jgi:hypothetical protein
MPNSKIACDQLMNHVRQTSIKHNFADPKNPNGVKANNLTAHMVLDAARDDLARGPRFWCCRVLANDYQSAPSFTSLLNISINFIEFHSTLEPRGILNF